MKQRAFVVVCLLALTLCLLSGCVEAAAALTPTDRFFVNDFAEVLSAETEDDIYARGVALYNKTKAQAVVVTVESMDGEVIEDFAYDLANAWGIGEAEKDTGVLILLAVEEREVRIEVGSGLEGRLTDGKTGRILDNYAIPYLREDDFSTGLQQAYAAVVNEIYYEFGLETDEGYVPVDQLSDTYGEEIELPDWAAIIVVLVVIALVIAKPRLLIFMGHGGRYHGGHGGGFHGGFGGHGGGGGFSGGGGGFSGGGSSRGF